MSVCARCGKSGPTILRPGQTHELCYSCAQGNQPEQTVPTWAKDYPESVPFATRMELKIPRAMEGVRQQMAPNRQLSQKEKGKFLMGFQQGMLTMARMAAVEIAVIRRELAAKEN